MTNHKVKFQCGECGELHTFEDDAHECCRPEVLEVYVCGRCQSLHLEEAEAEKCCEVDPSLGLPLATPQELEAAGQERMFI